MMALLNGRFKIIKFLLDEDNMTNPSMAINLPPIFNQSSSVVLLPLALVLIMAMDTRDIGYFEVIKELWSRQQHLFDYQTLECAINLIIIFGRDDILKLLIKSQLTKSLFLSLQTSKKVDGFIQKYLEGHLYLQ